MMDMFISELIGALFQVLLFSLIPFIWWICTARKKESFFKWIGLKRLKIEGKVINTVFITVAAAVVYGALSSLFIRAFEGEITAAGSAYAGKGVMALPAVIVYGFIRTGLSEEILFRGFLLKRFSDKFGFANGNTIQAVCFGALHGIPFGIATHNIGVTIMLTILPGAFGWYMGWLNEKRCGETIISSWLLHGLMNVAVACLSL